MIDPLDIEGATPARRGGLCAVRVGEWLVLGEREMRVRAYPNGPVLVTRAEEVLAEDGTAHACGRATVAICRCGKSRLGPFCDGTHRFAGSSSRREASDHAATNDPRPRHP